MSDGKLQKIDQKLSDNDLKVAQITSDKIHKAIEQDAQVIAFIKDNQQQLGDHPIDDNLEIFLEYLNQRETDTPIYPGYIPRLVLNGNLASIDYISEEPLQKNNIQTIIGDFDIDDKNADFANFQPDNDRMIVFEAVTQIVFELIENPNKFRQGLFMYGGYGVGKSYLLGAISNELSKNKIAHILVHWPSFIKLLQEQFGKFNNVNTDLIKKLQRVPVLLIDDLGADNISAWSRDDVLMTVLEYRMTQRKTTFFTSNLDFKHLQEEHLTITKDTTEPNKAERIMQRIKFLTKETLVGGQNKRKF